MKKSLSKNLDISSATARVAADRWKPWQLYQVQLSENLQLIDKTENHTGSQKNDISLGDQQSYHLQVFQRLY